MANLKMRSLSGDETIEFVVFNYDGSGSAIVFRNKELEILTIKEVKDIVLGKVGEEREYICIDSINA